MNDLSLVISRNDLTQLYFILGRFFMNFREVTFGMHAAYSDFHVTCVTVWTLFSVNNLGNCLFEMTYIF